MTGKRIIAPNDNSFSSFFERYSLAIVFFAFFLFSVFYVANRSFWIDESMVALSIVDSGISPFEPLTLHNQVSPWGFVLITKLVSLLFGAGDLQFRLPGILMYFASMGYLSLFLKRHYGITIALVFSFIILSNPLLLRYSTEFKHYLYEFSFAIILLTSYFEIMENNNRAKYTYGISAFLSIFFGISIIFVVAVIFGTEMLRRLRYSYKKPFMSKWFLLHIIVFAGFLVWYFVSITPNLYYNLINYPQVFNVDLGPGNLLNLNHWGKLFVILKYSILESISIILFSCFLATLYLFFTKRINKLNFSIISIPFFIYLLVYFLNFAGKYPILLDRHFLFMLPSVYHLFAFLVFKITTTFRNKHFQFILFSLLVGFSVGALINYQLRDQFYFQEIKPILKNLIPTDKVFLYFSAQPGYNWYKYSLYKDLPKPFNPNVNSETGLRIPIEEMESNLSELITKPGAWPTIALLTTTENYMIYADYLANQIIQVGQAKVIVSHRSGLELRNILSEKCTFSYFEKKKGAYIIDVNCP